VYERAGVDLVLAGHDHDYQRTTPQGGVTYVVTGGAATHRPTGRADITVTAASTYHFVELVAYPDRLEVRAVAQDGRIIDAFALPASGDRQSVAAHSGSSRQVSARRTGRASGH
jgi:hypothetical protein